MTAPAASAHSLAGLRPLRTARSAAGHTQPMWRAMRAWRRRQPLCIMSTPAPCAAAPPDSPACGSWGVRDPAGLHQAAGRHGPCRMAAGAALNLGRCRAPATLDWGPGHLPCCRPLALAPSRDHRAQGPGHPRRCHATPARADSHGGPATAPGVPPRPRRAGGLRRCTCLPRTGTPDQRPVPRGLRRPHLNRAAPAAAASSFVRPTPALRPWSRRWTSPPHLVPRPRAHSRGKRHGHRVGRLGKARAGSPHCSGWTALTRQGRPQRWRLTSDGAAMRRRPPQRCQLPGAATLCGAVCAGAARPQSSHTPAPLGACPPDAARLWQTTRHDVCKAAPGRCDAPAQDRAHCCAGALRQCVGMRMGAAGGARCCRSTL